MIDPELVTRKIVLIVRDLEELRPFAAKDSDAYLGSRIDELVVERCLKRMIGRMIDINYHLLAESGQAPPPDTTALSLGESTRSFRVNRRSSS